MVCEIIRPCQIMGNKHTENGVKVSVKCRREEQVTFYLLDNKKNPNCQLQKKFQSGKKICDLLVTYKINETKKIFCLTELEGKNFKDAAMQIMDTYHYFAGKKCCCEIEWRAYICFNLASPIKIDSKYEKMMLKEFPKNKFAFEKSHGHDNLGKFLRK